MRNSRCLMITLMLMFSGAVLMLEDGDGASVHTPSVTNYHNAFIHMNLTYVNGSPAEGLTVYIEAADPFIGAVSNVTDENGQTVVNITHLSYGPSRIWVVDGSGDHRWKGSTFVDPDDREWFDVVLSELPEPFTRVTGHIRNASSEETLEGFTISVHAYDHLGNWDAYTDLSDQQGRYIVRIPNTTRPCSITISGMGEFYYYSTSFQPGFGEEQFDLDIDLLPLYSPDVPVKLTYRNSTSGQKLSSGKLRVYGHNTDLDHYMYSRSNLMPDGSGDYSLMMGPGEYKARWESYYDPYWMVEYEVMSNFIINLSPLTLEVPLEIPELVPVVIEVWNDSIPLPTTGISYSHMVDSIHGDLEMELDNRYTNSSGKLFFGAPENSVVDLTIIRYGYQPKTVVLDTTGAVGTIEINTTIKPYEYGPTLPEGYVELTVMDPVSGLPLPDAYVSGNADGMIHDFSGYTGEDGTFEMGVASTDYDIYAHSSLGWGAVNGYQVKEGVDNILAIELERYEAIPGEYGFSFHVRDAFGEVLPNQLVSVECWDHNGYSFSLLSDNDGEVSFFGPQGTYLIYIPGSSPSSYGQSYSSPYRFFEVSGEGGILQDIIGYPASPLTELQGFVYDAGTMEPMAQVEITASSVKRLGDATRNGAPFQEDIVHLDTMNVGSISIGFYKTWGKDTLILEAFEDGYFPYYEEMDMSTRAPGDHDILMEELVDFDILVNGTLRDQDHRHIPGTVWIYDRDHPGFLVAEVQVNSTGEFAFYAYLGNFTAMYNNATLQDEMDFQVDGSDRQLDLILIPRSKISGTVLDHEGSPIGGVSVSLLWVMQGGDPILVWVNTSVDGTFEFEYQEGIYRIVIWRSELYNRYEGTEFHVDGWEEHNVEIVLENRTLGNISGRVYGEGGFLEDGIPWAVVTLHHGDMMVMSTQADGSGDFLLWNISDGYDYTLTVAPVTAHRAEEGIRSGYLDNSTYNISMYGYELHLDIYLPYRNHSTSEWLEFLLWSPVWSPEYASVPLDEPIHIQFSMPVNTSTVVSAVDIDPAPADMSYVWNAERTILRIDHDLFDPMTNYSVSVRNTILSDEGYPLFNYTGLDWNFTTGENVSTWRIHTAEVELMGMNLSVEVTGKENISVYMVITNVGSVLLEEGSNGTYSLLIPGHEFEYDTSYNYHFSSSVGGPDLVYALSGTFRTPEDPDPEPVWSLSSAGVEVLEGGTWNITAHGGENQSVYIVIDGVGSFLLVEGPAGTYTLLIGAEGFEGGEYPYHFSNEDGGADLAPGLSGMRTIEPEDGGDDGDGPMQWIIMLVLLMVIMGLIFVFVMVIRGRGDGTDLEGDEE